MSSETCPRARSDVTVSGLAAYCTSRLAASLLWAILIALTGSAAYGHVLGQGYVFLRPSADHVVAKLQLPVGSFEDALGVQLTATGKIDKATLEQALGVITEYVNAHYGLRVDGKTLQPELMDYGLFDTPIEQFIELRYRYSLTSLDGAEIRYTFFFDFDTDHRGVLLLQPTDASDADEGGEAIAVFAPGRDWQPVNPPEGSEPVEFRPASGQKWIGLAVGLTLILVLTAAVLWLARRKSRAR